MEGLRPVTGPATLLLIPFGSQRVSPQLLTLQILRPHKPTPGSRTENKWNVKLELLYWGEQWARPWSG